VVTATLEERVAGITSYFDKKAKSWHTHKESGFAAKSLQRSVRALTLQMALQMAITVNAEAFKEQALQVMANMVG